MLSRLAQTSAKLYPQLFHRLLLLFFRILLPFLNHLLCFFCLPVISLPLFVFSFSLSVFVFSSESSASQRRLEPVPLPQNLNLDRIVDSKNRIFRTELRPPESLKLSQFQNWSLCFYPIQSPSAQGGAGSFDKAKLDKANPAELEVDFLMPQHGHGLNSTFKVQPTKSHCSDLLRVNLHMPGWWQITVSWKYLGTEDSSTLNFIAVESTPSSKSLQDLDGWWLGLSPQSQSLLLGMALPSLNSPSSSQGVESVGTVKSLKSFNTLSAKENPHPALSNPLLIDLGRKVFFDKGLSQTGKTSCSTCHQPSAGFADTKKFSQGVETLGRNTPTLGAVGSSRFFTWDGKKDSISSQVQIPLMHPLEHGLSRDQIEKHLQKKYGTEIKEIVESRLLDPAFQSPSLELVGVALEAYLRRLSFVPSKLDSLIEVIRSGVKGPSDSPQMTPSEMSGLKIFLQEERCAQCHHGPLLSDQTFHNIGAPLSHPEEDQRGWILGAQLLIADPSRCGGPKDPFLILRADSRKNPKECLALNHLPQNKVFQIGAFKTPTLRNVAKTAPYFHGGQYGTLDAVLKHYSEAVQYSMGDSELIPFALSEKQKSDLKLFLMTLDSEIVEK